MSLYQVSTGQTINAADVNQLVDELEQQSGGQELGKYFLAGGIYANIATVSNYIPSRSRYSTPVSIQVDDADQGHTGGFNGVPIASNLTTAGFQIYCNNTTGPNTNGRAGGNYTIQF